MWGESVTDHGNFVRLQHRAADRKGNRPASASTGSRARLAWSFCREFVAALSCSCTQQRVGPLSILGHLADDARDLRRVRIEKRVALAPRHVSPSAAR